MLDDLRSGRSVTDILKNVFENIQDIIRSEVRLARAELKEEGRKAASAGVMFAAAAIVALYAGLFVLWAVVLGLALFIPTWAAALLVGFVLALTGFMLFNAGKARWQHVNPKPEKTIETLHELKDVREA